MPDINDHFFSIRSKTGRDIIWSVFGPALLQSSYAPKLSSLLPELTHDLCNRVDSVDIEFNSPRLGFCFEQMWQHALMMTNIDFVANLQIPSPTRTLGELDLIIPQAHQTQHVELALKFYLGVKDDWIGPNRRDLLSLKISHTTDHQLPLAQTPEAQTAIHYASQTANTREHKVSAPTVSAAVMRGCLFHPAHHVIPAQLPADVAQSHWRGQWCPADQLELLPEAHWYVLSKQDWISPILATFAISRTEIVHFLSLYFDYLSTPVCIARVREGAYGWAEVERWMIVPSDWETI